MGIDLFGVKVLLNSKEEKRIWEQVEVFFVFPLVFLVGLMWNRQLQYLVECC